MSLIPAILTSLWPHGRVRSHHFIGLVSLWRPPRGGEDKSCPRKSSFRRTPYQKQRQRRADENGMTLTINIPVGLLIVTRGERETGRYDRGVCRGRRGVQWKAKGGRGWLPLELLAIALGDGEVGTTCGDVGGRVGCPEKRHFSHIYTHGHMLGNSRHLHALRVWTINLKCLGKNKWRCEFAVCTFCVQDETHEMANTNTHRPIICV